MSEFQSSIENDFVRDVLAYFLAHPDASESLEGIQRWRAAEGHARVEIARALERLVALRRLTHSRRADGTCVYRLSHEPAGEDGVILGGRR